mgnify:CR=1 FL=1
MRKSRPSRGCFVSPGSPLHKLQQLRLIDQVTLAPTLQFHPRLAGATHTTQIAESLTKSVYQKPEHDGRPIFSRHVLDETPTLPNQAQGRNQNATHCVEKSPSERPLQGSDAAVVTTAIELLDKKTRKLLYVEMVVDIKIMMDIY